jgi:CRP-like cAMP-binding protein
MRLVDAKTQALRYVVLGDLPRALAVYTEVVRAVPSDLDARMKVADLLVAARLPELAQRAYAAVAFLDLSTGRPLHAVVTCQALHSLGHEVAPLYTQLAAIYGHGSPHVAAHGQGARLAPPAPDSEVAAPDLERVPELAAAARAATEVAADTTTLGPLPTRYPPLPLLSELSPVAFERVLRTAQVRRLPNGAQVVKEGEPGTSFFLVAAGRVRVYATDTLGRRSDLAQLSEGAIFGELALVTAQPRSASVEVVGEADLIELGTGAIRAAARELEQLAEALDRFTRDRLLKNLLASSPLFRPFSPQQRLDLARRFTGHDVAPGTDIIREGDVGRGLYIVLAGEVEVLKGEEPFQKTLATLRPGGIFGEMALIRGVPASATVRAARPSTVLFLAREYFDRLVGALPEMRRFFEELTEERLKDAELELVDAEALLDEDASVLV